MKMYQLPSPPLQPRHATTNTGEVISSRSEAATDSHRALHRERGVEISHGYRSPCWTRRREDAGLTEGRRLAATAELFSTTSENLWEPANLKTPTFWPSRIRVERQ
jgi:hypothetical protein